ncbi:MAG: MarR family transcriptional regulator [Lachnospiraceae bacterium]|nr:MarR family transcriptional regulator [Lachnospiraceae bacterium]
MEKDLHHKDCNDNLIIHFLDINHTMRFLYEGRGSQKHILIVLLETETITQKKLTKRLGIQPGSASEVLAKLEKGGLIVRTENPDDRRTTYITLTKQGQILAEEAIMQRKNRHKEMFSCLTEDEKSTLLALLEKINADWQKRYQNKNDQPCGRCGCDSEKQYHENEGR